MTEETLIQEFAKRMEGHIETARAQMGAQFDKMNRSLDKNILLLDEIMKKLGIILEDNRSDYEVLKDDQESIRKEINDCSGSNEVKNCIRSVDCNCECCFDGCSRKINEGENQVEVVHSVLEFFEQEDQLSEGFLGEKDNELNKLFTMEVSQIKTPPNIHLKFISCAQYRIGQSVTGFECNACHELYEKNYNSNNSLKLFDELSKREATCWFTVMTDHVNVQRHLYSPSVLVPTLNRNYDWDYAYLWEKPSLCVGQGIRLISSLVGDMHIAGLCRGSVKMLSRASFIYVSVQKNHETNIVFDPGGLVFNMLHHLKELLGGAKIAVGSSFPFLVYSLDYANTQLVYNAQAVNKLILRRFNRLLDVPWKNVNSNVGGLHDSSLASFSFGWDIIVGVVTSILAICLSHMKVSSLEHHSAIVEVVLMNKGMILTCWADALRFKNRVYLHWKHLLLLAHLLKNYHSQQTASILSCIMFVVTGLDTVLLIANLRTWAISYGLLYYEQDMIPLYLLFRIPLVQMQNRGGWRLNQKTRWKAFFDFAAFDIDNLATLLVSWVMKVVYTEDFEIQLLNFIFSDGSNEDIFWNSLIGLGLLLQNANGFIVEDLIDFYCYRSFDKGTKDGGTTGFENLLSGEDVHYMLGSLETLELYKKIGSAKQRAIVEGYRGMFSIGENFKEIVQLVSRNTTNAMLAVSEMDIVDAGNSTDSFFIVVISGTIYIEACGTHSLQIYFNLIINMRKLGAKFVGILISLTTKGPQEIYSGRSHFLINDFAIAINYLHNQSLTPAVHSVIKAHSQGDNRRAIWEDLSVHVGGNAINAECGLDSRKIQIDMIVSSKKSCRFP